MFCFSLLCQFQLFFAISFPFTSASYFSNSFHLFSVILFILLIFFNSYSSRHHLRRESSHCHFSSSPTLISTLTFETLSPGHHSILTLSPSFKNIITFVIFTTDDVITTTTTPFTTPTSTITTTITNTTTTANPMTKKTFVRRGTLCSACLCLNSFPPLLRKGMRRRRRCKRIRKRRRKGK